MALATPDEVQGPPKDPDPLDATLEALVEVMGKTGRQGALAACKHIASIQCTSRLMPFFGLLFGPLLGSSFGAILPLLN